MKSLINKPISFFHHYSPPSSAVLCLTISREEKMGQKTQACMTSVDENRCLTIRVKKKIGALFQHMAMLLKNVRHRTQKSLLSINKNINLMLKCVDVGPNCTRTVISMPAMDLSSSQLCFKLPAGSSSP